MLSRLGLAVVLAVVLAIAGTATAVVVDGGPPDRCVPRGNDNPTVTLTGAQGEYERNALHGGTLIDANRAHWQGETSYALVAGGESGICITGAQITGSWSPQTPWSVMHGTAGIVLSSPVATVQDVRVHDYGDAIRFVDHAQDWEVRRAWLSYIRDDCIEDDWQHAGTVRDSLLEGCYNAFSSRTYDGQSGVSDGSGNTFTVTHSLVWLRPMAKTYNGEGEPGTAGFFKWDDAAPKLSLHGNVFRADQQAGTVGLGIPPGKLASCSNNVMVWLGHGRYPDPLPRCFKVTRNVHVWDRAVRQWHRQFGG